MSDIDKAIARAREIEQAATPSDWFDIKGSLQFRNAEVCGSAQIGEGPNRALIVHARNTHKLVWDALKRAADLVAHLEAGGQCHVYQVETRDALDALARAVLQGGE